MEILGLLHIFLILASMHNWSSCPLSVSIVVVISVNGNVEILGIHEDILTSYFEYLSV